MPLIYLILLLCSVCMSLYYPALYSEISLLDDSDLFRGLAGIQHLDIIGAFFPHSHGGLYYRPIIYISFLMDRFIWDLNPVIMHFENILLHLTNTILILLIARLIITKTSKLPLFAALFFAVHPLATESVNWISGRTDLLAVAFILVSLYTVLCFRSSRRFWQLGVSVIALIMGIMSKETALGFIPALVFILTSRKKDDTDLVHRPGFRRQSLYIFLAVCVLSLVAALFFYTFYLSIAIALTYFFYLLWCRRERLPGVVLQKIFFLCCITVLFFGVFIWGIRKIAFSSQSPNIQRTFGILLADINYTLSLLFKAVGFYVKKFIVPFPLNFVIRDVSPYYTLFGIVLLCLVVVLMARRKLPDTLAIAGFCMIAPVLPLVFQSIAWTPYAERYVYPAAPFWVLALAVYAESVGFDRFSLRVRRWCLAGALVLFVTMAVSTFQRNLVWQTNLALFKDSVEKTPDSMPARGTYMAALFEKGLYDEALHQYQMMQSLPVIQLAYRANYDLFYVQILIAKKQYSKAEQELDRINQKIKGKDPDVYERYLELAAHTFIKTVDGSEKERIKRKRALSYDKLYELTKDPMILYRKGQFLLSMNEKLEAGSLFARAAMAFPEKSHYRAYSAKLARNLKNGRQI